MAERLFVGSTQEERLAGEVQEEIDAALERIRQKINAVRNEQGYPWKGAQLMLHQYLVREAKESLWQYAAFLEIEGKEYWQEARHELEPPYAE